MASASPVSRVNVRDVLRVKAVDSYVRNFAGESHRLQELLEITLSYGVYCVSRNFQLKGMTVDELRTVTKYDKTKTQDFYVRNATKPRRPQLVGDTDPQQLYSKAPHSWRDGESKPEVAVTVDPNPPERTSSPSEPEVFFLPSEAHKDKLDEIDFYTRVLGKAFVDVTWATYSSRGSAYLDSQQLQDCMTRVDQRKRPDRIPLTELPVCSFVEFLNAYVKTSVAKVSTLTEPAETHAVEPDHESSVEEDRSASQRPRPFSINAKHERHTGRDAARATTPRPRTPPAPLTPRDSARGVARPSAFQNVESKIKPELRAHKEKLLRVKKTQAQLMKESLARARLSEYAAKREEATQSPLPVKRMPLDKITPGAAALEIVDDFIRSPLMDKFSGEVHTAHQQPSRSARRDPLKEELYGTAAHDDSFLGCKAPASQPKQASRKAKEAKKTTRDYSGWLGDFGPQHTKTVRPAWETDATDGDGYVHANESSDDENERDPKSRQAIGRRDRFEWKLDVPANSRDQAKHSTSRLRRKPIAGSDYDGGEDSLSISDDWSARSDVSDPVYGWLKTAVQ